MAKEMDRRQFVKGMALTGVTVVSAAALAGCGSAGANGSGAIDWTEETDVVVIGSGFAALAAALEAKNGGADVTVIEKMSVPGGNSTINGGAVAACGSKFQENEGVEDSVETMVDDMLYAGLYLNHVEKARTIAEKSNEALEWTMDYLGVEYPRELLQFGGHSRKRTLETPDAVGADIIKPMVGKLKELGVNIGTKRKFERFIQNEEGRVIGVEIKDGYKFPDESSGKSLFIKAKKAVILASGGFGRDIPMRTIQDPRLTEELDCTNQKGATGEALREALKIGGVGVQLSWIQLGPWASPDEEGFGYVSYFSCYNYPYCVHIDVTTGKRLMNELADRKRQADAIILSGKPCLQLIDSRGVEHAQKFALEGGMGNGSIKKFDSLEEVASNYGLPVKPFMDEMNRYNSFVQNKEDLDFGKPIREDAKPIAVAPFYVSRLWPKVHHCMGGIGTNMDGQVLNQDGETIKGLYAAGEVAGGTHGACRLGSCGVTDCLVFGRITGQLAAKEESWA